MPAATWVFIVGLPIYMVRSHAYELQVHTVELVPYTLAYG